MTETETGILAWHFLHDDHRLQFPPHTLVETGQTLRVEPPLKMCEHGLHASIRPLDALAFAPGSIVCRVGLGGEILDGDRLCASERTVLWMADATRTLHEFACWCAEQALERERAAGCEPDPRSWAAIEAKRAWLRGETSNAALDAARKAAVAAAKAAVWDGTEAVAWAVAWAAVTASPGNAAWAAAWDVAWAAAEDTAWEAQNTELERRLMELEPREGEKSGE
ncbi:MAG: hypothetical protein VB144_11660 [Clostridia bacterium]|nr:hypothetical protein [Clostridia bacterium]